jgi:hypothetical protein
MTFSRQVLSISLVAAVCAGAGLVPSAAGAATLRGTVVGKPVSAGKSVVVPVLLSAAGDRAAGAALARVVVPSNRVRTAFASIRPLGLRIGDRVSATVPRITTRPRATLLRVTRRGLVPTFATTQNRRVAISAKVKRAIAATEQLKLDPMSVLDPKNPATTNEQLRDQLLAVRTDLNFLISDLRTTADALEATVAAITAVRPADPSRRAAIERRQAKTLAALKRDATTARGTVVALDDAVGRLDETINAVGGAPSAAPLPIETTTTASNILNAVFDLLRGPDGPVEGGAR